MEKIISLFMTKKFVLANLPTGAGKTIVATAVQRLLGVPAVHLTHTISLQEQYQKTMPWALVVTGRANHECLLPGPMDEKVTARDAPCTSAKFACEYIKPDGCSYYKMLFSAKGYEQVILNYAYATRIIPAPYMRRLRQDEEDGPTPNPFHRPFLVCDEADLAEPALVDAARITFSRRRWKEELGIDLPPSVEVETWKQWAQDSRFEIEHLVKGKIAVLEDNAEGVKQKTRLLNMLEVVGRMSTINENEWIIQEDSGNLDIRPLWGRSVSKSLFLPFSKVLLMSGTLGPPDLLCKKLGIEEKDMGYIEAPSTFPVEVRPVKYWPVVKLNRFSKEEDYERLTSAIQFLANNHPDRKGIIHSGSFHLAKEIYGRLRDDPRFYYHEGGGERSKALTRFVEAEEPLVLITPSFTTGIDLPYQIGWQVIAKVPFGNLGDPIVKARRESVIDGVGIGKMNYDSEALHTVIQSCGRAVRAADDWGISYILDGNFWPLYKRTFAPEYFREAISWL